MKFKKLFFFTLLYLAFFLIRGGSNFYIYSTENFKNQDIVAGIVPHHLLASPLIDSFFYYLSTQDHPHTIVILSPDHFLSCVLEENNSFLAPDLSAPSSELKQVKIDSELGKRLRKSIQINSNQSAIIAEHGVMELIPFIKKYLPATMILPLLVPAKTNREEIEDLVEAIYFQANYPIILIASVDFSHFLPQQVADFHDLRSIRVIINREKDAFNNLDVDCWQALYAIRYFAHLVQGEEFILLGKYNSNDFLTQEVEKTTSYCSAVFTRVKKGEDSLNSTIKNNFCHDYEKVKTIIMVGDLMLDRGIKELIMKNGLYYPFQKINRLLKGVDLVVGNLEGPVVEIPPESPINSLKFSFSPQILLGAVWGNFNLFSLANNHILDRGKKGLEETQKWLERYDLKFVGNPLQNSLSFPDTSFKDKDLNLLAFNQIPPYFITEEEIVNIVEKEKIDNSDKFLIVMLHWGKEYTSFPTPNQRVLAHQLIEKGADLIIGHHPHLVQNIELYQDRLIFYSLGNFIFDQYFSAETQEGLVVGVEIYTDKIIYRLFPIQINQGQPRLMENKLSEDFLKKLAYRSDREISQDIEKGIIKLER